MKIVIANRYFHPDQSATSRMVSSLAFSLARQGVSVTVVTSPYLQNGKDAMRPGRESIDGVSVHRVRTSGFGRGRIAGRIADYVTFHLSLALWWLANVKRGDVCVVCTDPPLLSVSSALPIALRGGKLVNWVMDLFPETAIELGVLRKTGMVARISMMLRNWSLKMSDLTICPMQAMTDYLAGKGGSKARFVTVHHWSDGSEIHPVAPADNSLRREWQLDDAFIVGYSGNFGRAHEFSTLLDAAEMLRDQDAIHFLLIGDGQRRAFMEAEVRRRRLSNVHFKPYQPSNRLAESLSVADVHIVSLLPRLEHCIVPSKFYGILAAGRPTLFIGAPDGEVASVAAAADCGAAVAPGNPRGLVDRIKDLQNSKRLRASMGANARQLLERDYTLGQGVRRWHEAISPLSASESEIPVPSGSKEAAI